MADCQEHRRSPSRPTRRHDSFTRVRDKSLEKHLSGRVYHRPVGGETLIVDEPTARAAYVYDSKHHHSFGAPGNNGRARTVSRSPLRYGPSWPPHPTCEDEVTSLAKEAISIVLLEQIGREDVPCRGQIDQEPILQDLSETGSESNKCSILLAESETGSRSTGIPTPPTSDDERKCRARHRPSRLRTNFEESVPEISKRTASPYAFTTSTQPKDEYPSGGQYLSPNVTTLPVTDSSQRRHRVEACSHPSSPRRDASRRSPLARKGNDYFSLSGTEVNHTSNDTPRQLSDSRMSVRDFAAPSSTMAPIGRSDLDYRRTVNSARATPALPNINIEKLRQPEDDRNELDEIASTSAASSMAESALNASETYRSRESSYASSRPTSAMSSRSQGPTPPPRSPRLSSEMSNDSFVKRSAASSRQTSFSDSRPTSPSPQTPVDSPRLPRTDLDWSVLIAANAARKPHRSSRMTLSMRHDSAPIAGRPNHDRAPSLQSASAVPYPGDGDLTSPIVSMPSERSYQYYAEKASGFNMPPESDAKNSRTAASTTSRNASFGSVKLVRPILQTRHSVATTSPIDERAKPFEKPASAVLSPQTRKELAALLKKELPDCPRTKPVAGYDDWYTIFGAPNLDLCPTCVGAVFERTIFRPSIRRSPPRSLNIKVSCAFGSSPWIRMAWLLTLQQQRTDLLLLKDVAEVEEISEPCPGHQAAVRSWYGLRDLNGLFARDFHVCVVDVRRIEKLLPTLSGLFDRHPSRASHEKRICALRAEGNRFWAYLDALISTHEKAVAAKRAADPMPLIDLVERKTQLRECTRDTMLVGGLWHFVPGLPAFTVCEDCFELIVEPEIKKGSDIAARFNRTVQPVYVEGVGSSCQLYSRRMRKVFHRAVQDNDMKYLIRKAKERREAELRLQEKYSRVMGEVKRLKRDGDGREDDEWVLNRDLDRITEEWQSKWE